MHMRLCYLDCHGLDCAVTQYYTHKTYYVHYSCFSSICDLFTDSLVDILFELVSQHLACGV
jgi:hypothetical protein